MKRIRYSRNISDICLVHLYRDTWIGKRLIDRQHIATVEYLHGESVKMARKIVAALNRKT